MPSFFFKLITKNLSYLPAQTLETKVRYENVQSPIPDMTSLGKRCLCVSTYLLITESKQTVVQEAKVHTLFNNDCLIVYIFNAYREIT